jgi:DNA-binding MarR family transcriptional regulator/GNAT superfamily N-acetyltransferase
MDAELVARVRGFNRVVTQRIGALDDTYLSRGRPLGQARLLWEIGPEGTRLRELRSRLELDSGYLSRLLRALEAAGMVQTGADEHDARLRTATLTAAGLAERAELDRRSNRLAETMLEPLSDGQRQRLVGAMAEVQRLLGASSVRFAVVDPRRPEAQRCLNAYFGELAQRFETGFDRARSLLLDEDDLRPPHGLLLLASLYGEVVGCGGLHFFDGGIADVKRMWVSSSVRGSGVGRRLLVELERQASAHGVRLLRLETNRALKEATAMYRGAGFRATAPFNDEPYADYWFAKPLTTRPSRAPARRYRSRPLS